MKQALFDRVQQAGKHGIDRRTLFDYLYANDANGGPLSFNIISQHICGINRKLKKVNYPFRIASTYGNKTGRGGNAIYTLERKEVAQ